jgi:hypothetical protein
MNRRRCLLRLNWLVSFTDINAALIDAATCILT